MKNVNGVSGLSVYKRLRLYCSHCRADYYPDDELLGISRCSCSKGLARSIVAMSTFMPYADAKRNIKETMQLDLSVTMIKQVVLRFGAHLHLFEEADAKRPYSIIEKEKDVDVLYVLTDGAMVPVIGEEKTEYKENKLGLVYNNYDIVHKISKKGQETAKIIRKKFVSSIGEGVDPFKKLLFSAAVKKGFYSAKKIIFISDGAAWIAKCKEEYFPQAIRILDWYHAVEHLWETARALFGEDQKDKCLEWVKPLESLLWSGQVDCVIDYLDSEILKRKKDQELLIKLRGYYVSNKDCMNYQYYREQGWQIGSGSIESANKYVITQRLRQCGMKWKESNADAMIWARAKYYEGDWNSFWKKMKLSDYLLKDDLVQKHAA